MNKEYLQAVKENPSIPEKDRAIGAVAITWEGRKSYGGDTCQECLDTASADFIVGSQEVGRRTRSLQDYRGRYRARSCGRQIIARRRLQGGARR